MKLNFTYICILLAIFSCDNSSSNKENIQNIQEPIGLPLQTPDSKVTSFKQNSLHQLQQKFPISDLLIFKDTFKQQEVKPPVVDILVIIDNSGSMAEEQLNLSDKLSFLISDLHDVDWKINVITTDNTCKRLAELPLSPDTPNMSQIFRDAVRAGINGSGYEMALKNTVNHFFGSCRSDSPWKRDDANLAVIIVSDEDEDGFSRYSENSNLFFSDMEEKGFKATENFKVYGIIGHPSAPCEDVYKIAVTYADVIDKSGGLWGDICDQDYSATLSAVARDIRKNLKLELPLSYQPVLTTIELILDGRVYSGDWSLVGQSIILSEALPESTTLEIEYQIESSRLLKLNVTSEDYTLNFVSIDGEVIDSSTYVYDYEKNTILLTFDPKIGAEIIVELIENKQPQNSFPFPGIKIDYIACYLDNQLFDSKYKVERQIITFEPPIPAGKTVTCLY